MATHAFAPASAPVRAALVREPRRLMQPGGAGRLSIMLGCVYDDVRMGPSTQRMLGVLGTYADTKTGMCRPDQRTLATRLGISRQAVSRALRDLAAAGYIEIIERFSDFNGARLASHYRVRTDFDLPEKFRRTSQPEPEGYQPDIDTPQPDIEYPLSIDELPPQRERATPLSLVDTPPQPDVASVKEERPRENDPERTTQRERPKPDPAGDVEQELFDYYRAKIHPRVRVNAPEKIRARLKTFTVAELKQAIDNFAADWWWMKHNATQGVEWFFRSDRQCERFVNLVPRTAPEADPPSRNGTHRAAPTGVATTAEEEAALEAWANGR